MKYSKGKLKAAANPIGVLLRSLSPVLILGSWSDLRPGLDAKQRIRKDSLLTG